MNSGGSRIFPGGGVRQLPKVLLFFNFVPENCMKMKEFGPQGGACVPGAPLRSANDETDNFFVRRDGGVYPDAL